MLNKVMLIGRLGQDPELRYTKAGGVPVTTLNVATDESYVDRDGNKQKITEWHRVVVFQRQAENCCNYLGKGSLVYVEGSLTTRKWQDQNGQERSTTEIKARNIQFLDRKGERYSEMPNGEEGESYGGYQQRQPRQNQQWNQHSDYGQNGRNQGRGAPRPGDQGNQQSDYGQSGGNQGRGAPNSSEPWNDQPPQQPPRQQPEEYDGPAFPSQVESAAYPAGGSESDVVPF